MAGWEAFDNFWVDHGRGMEISFARVDVEASELLASGLTSVDMDAVWAVLEVIAGAVAPDRGGDVKPVAAPEDCVAR